MRRLLLLLTICLLPIPLLTGQEVLYKPFQPPQTADALADVIQTAVIQNRYPEFLSLMARDRDRVSSDLLCSAYYQAGQKFYQKKLKNLALKCWLAGFMVFGENQDKSLCAYESARVLYQNGSRQSALHYANRALALLPLESPLYEQARRLKRRIRWEYISTYEGLPDQSISCIEFEGDDTWIGMWTGGIARYTRSANTLQLFRSGDRARYSRHVRSIMVNSNEVLTATFDGLYSFDKKREKWSREEGRVGRVPVKQLKRLDGRIAAATLGRGIFLWNGKTWKAAYPGAKKTTDLLRLPGGLWISSLDKGLEVFRPGAKKSETILANVPVKSLAFYNGKIFAATHGEGISVFSQGGMPLTNLGAQSGLPTPYVETLEVINGYLVIGTLGGGAVIYSEPQGVKRILTVLDGLPSNDVVKIRQEKDRVWFGTLSGGIGILLLENGGDW